MAEVAAEYRRLLDALLADSEAARSGARLPSFAALAAKHLQAVLAPFARYLAAFDGVFERVALLKAAAPAVARAWADPALCGESAAARVGLGSSLALPVTALARFQELLAAYRDLLLVAPRAPRPPPRPPPRPAPSQHRWLVPPPSKSQRCRPQPCPRAPARAAIAARPRPLPPVLTGHASSLLPY